MSATIPSSLYRDRYWRPVLHLFKEHPKLNQCFTTKFFDFSDNTIKVQSLQRNAGPWSNSEKIMLKLAFHLFNERYKFNLSDLDYLDDYNKKLAFDAMKMRFTN
ncbi:hypothetical protein [Bacillus suaedae]|uniref:Uncharacterized protein n=1 Tax=Halalkalibacter suaedae TaxID=2822140 RepID=A0A940WRH4_9BACI|nr:hypothetical protein [Bacillus suaedae]MBP3951155.1 hypothetical protein [Bacillus suaedae]